LSANWDLPEAQARLDDHGIGPLFLDRGKSGFEFADILKHYRIKGRSRCGTGKPDLF